MGCGSHIHKHTANEEHSKDVNYWETFQYGLYTIRWLYCINIKLKCTNSTVIMWGNVLPSSNAIQERRTMMPAIYFKMTSAKRQQKIKKGMWV